MQSSEPAIQSFTTFLPLLIVISISIAVLGFFHWLLIARRPEIGNESKFPRQLIMLCLTIISVLAVIFSLPVSEGSRNQLIGFVGILLSGIIAFSSTNVISNLMAGLLLRITKPFRTGDFIRVGEFFGRVSERGLFDTEIQSENREFIALPNTLLVNNAVTTTPSAGAIVTAQVSLGYDIHHAKVESMLIQAAEKSGLQDPFVTVIELGNFSINYRVAGMLQEAKGIITARSSLLRSILDTIHGEGWEIMSPSIMNQRKLDDKQKVIPEFAHAAPFQKPVSSEEIVFDKAEQAEKIESEKLALVEEIKDLEAAVKEASSEEKEQLKKSIEQKRVELKSTEQIEVESNLKQTT